MTDSLAVVTKFHFRWARNSIRGAALLAIVALFASAHPARAQNLVPDPFFTNGLPENGGTDSAGNGVSYFGATAATFHGMTGIMLSGSGDGGLFELAPLVNYNTNNVNYAFTFSAVAIDPQTSTSIEGQFGTTAPTDNCGDCVDFVQSLTSSMLTPFTLTGTSSAGSNGFLGLRNPGGGDVFVTGLDFEPAPAPLPGGGLLSFCAAMGGLAVHRLRRRRAA